MADVHSVETRSYNMSRIRNKNTKPEEIVRKYLFAQGFRYRKNDARLPGTPDIVLPKYKTVIFVNGCFWHGHTGCRYFVWPKTMQYSGKKRLPEIYNVTPRITVSSWSKGGVSLIFGNVNLRKTYQHKHLIIWFKC